MIETSLVVVILFIKTELARQSERDKDRHARGVLPLRSVHDLLMLMDTMDPVIIRDRFLLLVAGTTYGIDPRERNLPENNFMEHHYHHYPLSPSAYFILTHQHLILLFLLSIVITLSFLIVLRSQNIHIRSILHALPANSLRHKMKESQRDRVRVRDERHVHKRNEYLIIHEKSNDDDGSNDLSICIYKYMQSFLFNFFYRTHILYSLSIFMPTLVLFKCRS